MIGFDFKAFTNLRRPFLHRALTMLITKYTSDFDFIAEIYTRSQPLLIQHSFSKTLRGWAF